jgi:DNA primase
MRSDVDTIKERLDITEIISGYVKVEKTGANFKARCPFHNEKTPSFFVSPVRQSYYCFGCGAKGDIFSFIEEIEGLDFRGALKLLAERAGVELSYHQTESKEEKEQILAVLEESLVFFEKELVKKKEAHKYLTSRGLESETVKSWRLGYAPAEWRSLYTHLLSLGYSQGIILKAGLIKTSDTSANKEPYDVFRDRIIFPLADTNGRTIAFSGRALPSSAEIEEGPKYLNSPDTSVFTKSEVLYGLDRAKDHIRKKDYSVLVEGQLDLVLSHQSGVINTVATSGTAFTHAHLERLKRLSSRVILAFDGDLAGEKAAEKSSILAISLDLEVKVAHVPEGLDPAEIAKKDPQKWKDILRQSQPAIEHFFNKLVAKEPDSRKLGKQIEKKILPMIKLMKSAIEQSHFISLIAKRTGIKEEILWEDLKRVERASIVSVSEHLNSSLSASSTKEVSKLSYKEQIEERLAEIKLWQKELPKSASEALLLEKEESELVSNLATVSLHEDLKRLSRELAEAESSQENKRVTNLTDKIRKVHDKIRTLEEKKKVL